ncbi:MAG: hypothetical protein ACE5FU_06760, partial [Nitrospinota bacterium]
MNSTPPGSLPKALAVVGLLGALTIFYTLYSVLHAKMPQDGMHKNVSSDFVCLGCHNYARTGGDSFSYHFK